MLTSIPSYSTFLLFSPISFSLSLSLSLSLSPNLGRHRLSIFIYPHWYLQLQQCIDSRLNSVYCNLQHISIMSLLCVLSVNFIGDYKITLAGPEILKGGGIGPVVIYSKCTRRTICLLYGKSGLLEKNSEPIEGAAAAPPIHGPPFESANVRACRLPWRQALVHIPTAYWCECFLCELRND